MKNEYLSTGFPDVDQAKNKDAYFNCLKLLDSLPYYKECKNRSYDLLDLKPGLTVLDAGCGMGDDAFRIAKLVMPGGKVVGLDASTAMIEKAGAQDLAIQLPVQFRAGDIKALPFPGGSFSRCRIDRVLQYIPEPEQAIAELVRVLEPDGLLLAYDNDWETFSIASCHGSTTQTIKNIWGNSFTNRRIGRDLPRYFFEAGLSDIKTYSGASVITDFETANKVYNLRETVQKAIEERRINASQGRDWIEELIHRNGDGSFLAQLTAYTVVGRKAVKTADG
jgi:ubiquinone/menaquinone biosynthesis C-methylase UbiE